MNGEDAVEHIKKVLKMADLLTTPNVATNRLLLHIFPITLTKAVSRWFKDEPDGSITTWVDLTELFSKYYPPSHTGRKKEVNRIDTDGERDPTNVEFAKWLASKFTNHLTMDSYTKNALWIYWKKGNDEEVLTNEELSGLEEENTGEENEIAEIFKIETDIFHFETPLCKAFKELNYLL
ncbi:hypothetical protein Tco_0234192 [Tanacetum coccineum]